MIYYFKLFQVSNHHRDHVPLYGFFRRKRKDDQPSLPIIRCWWVVICWFKYYFKLVGGFKPFETYQIGSFPHERLKIQKLKPPLSYFQSYGNNLERKSPASQTHPSFWMEKLMMLPSTLVGSASMAGPGEVLWLCCFGCFFHWCPFQKKLNEAGKSSVI